MILLYPFVVTSNFVVINTRLCGSSLYFSASIYVRAPVWNRHFDRHMIDKWWDVLMNNELQYLFSMLRGVWKFIPFPLYEWPTVILTLTHPQNIDTVTSEPWIFGVYWRSCNNLNITLWHFEKAMFFYDNIFLQLYIAKINHQKQPTEEQYLGDAPHWTVL